MKPELYHPGLRGVVAGETEICRLEGGIQYRGYCLHDLAEGASFLEVAHLLLFEELPCEEQFADFVTLMTEELQLPSTLLQLYEQLPVHNAPLEVLRAGIDLLNLFDPEPEQCLLHSGHQQAVRLLAKVPMLIGAWQRIRSGLPVLDPEPDLSYVANFYYLMTGQIPCALYERALEVALIVAAEHEFNPSTYAARIVGSARSNQYGPVLAALDAFMGRGHGGGDDRPLDLLQEVGSSEHADDWLRHRDKSLPLPGFGHPVFEDCDPRCSILEVECERLAQACGRVDWEHLADAVERSVWQHRRLPANIDWALARLFTYLELDRELFRPIFVAARLVGWCAHAVEQCESGNLIRPRARYRGAMDLPFEPMKARTL